MKFAWRNETDKKEDDPLLGYFAPWPSCTVCEDQGDVDLTGKTYTNSTSALNLQGVGIVIPGFTAHMCRTCKTWHTTVISIAGGSKSSMRISLTDREVETLKTNSSLIVQWPNMRAPVSAAIKPKCRT